MIVINGRIYADEVARKVRTAAASGLRQTAEEMMTESKRLVPVDTGTLKGSGYVEPVDMADLSVRLGFGGPAEPYALVQHEDLSLRHPGGGQAKFLEIPVNALAPKLTENVGNAIRDVING